MKMTLTNLAKLEASWEIIKDDINYSSSELKSLYKPFIKELHQVFGNNPDITGLSLSFNLFYSDETNVEKATSIQHISYYFKRITTKILKLLHSKCPTKKEYINMMLKSYLFKSGTLNKFKKNTFNLD